MTNDFEIFKKENFFVKTPAKSSLGNIFPCQLQMLNLSCFGCCGRRYKSKEEIFKDLANNTKEFNKIKFKHSLNLLKFRDRLSDDPWKTTNSGICSNLVKFSNQIIVCPLHPKINKIIPKTIFNLVNNKFDLRKGHCDVNYECKLFKAWKNFSNEQRLKFIEFVKNQNFDNYSFSIANVEDTNLYNFLDILKRD